MTRLVAALIAMLSIGWACAAVALAGAAPPEAVAGARYRVGQRWSYRTRPGEEKSTLTILKIETEGGQVIVHIAIEGVRVANPKTEGGFTTRVGHAPMDASALDRSVTRLRSTKVHLPPFQEGYDQWKAAHGGVFTITVAEALASVEASLK